MRHPPLTLVQISDLHFDPSEPQAGAMLQEIRERITRVKPDLIIASGDVSAEGHHHPGRFVDVRAFFDTLPAPVLCIPGNHDVGNKVGVLEDEVREAHVDHWCEIFGADRFATDRGGWRILGLNSQIIGSGFPREQEQLAWLDAQLDEAKQLQVPVAIFMHTPPYLTDPADPLTGRENYWALDPGPRQAIIERLAQPHVKLVANGHLHWHYATRRGEALWLWCPPLAFIVDAAPFPRGGGVAGFICYQLKDQQVAYDLVPVQYHVPSVWFHRPRVDLPGQDAIVLSELVLDFAGTLAIDGHLLPGVADRLRQLSRVVRITVTTTDRRGRAQLLLEGLPVEVQVCSRGDQKAQLVRTLGPDHVVAIGNGRSDAPMCKQAAIGIAVEGPDGVATDLMLAADIVVKNIHDALDLVANPQRLKGTLRE